MTNERHDDARDEAAARGAAASDPSDGSAETGRDIADAFDSLPADGAQGRSDAPAEGEENDLEAVRAEAARDREHLQRLQAEFENYRKRVLREQTQAVDLAGRARVELRAAS